MSEVLLMVKCVAVQETNDTTAEGNPKTGELVTFGPHGLDDEPVVTGEVTVHVTDPNKWGQYEPGTLYGLHDGRN